VVAGCESAKDGRHRQLPAAPSTTPSNGNSGRPRSRRARRTTRPTRSSPPRSPRTTSTASAAMAPPTSRTASPTTSTREARSASCRGLMSPSMAPTAATPTSRKRNVQDVGGAQPRQSALRLARLTQPPSRLRPRSRGRRRPSVRGCGWRRRRWCPRSGRSSLPVGSSASRRPVGKGAGDGYALVLAA
jgi:hypothetical protein